MRKPYCCEASIGLFEQYYNQQQNGGADFPVHVGVYRQRGHGIGSVFASLYRRILPFVKSLAPSVLRTGAEIIDDVSKGKTWKQAAKDAAKSRLPESLTKIAFNEDNQIGSGLRRKHTLNRKKKKPKRCKRDIFS
jgi:hypothetical protein